VANKSPRNAKEPDLVSTVDEVLRARVNARKNSCSWSRCSRRSIAGKERRLWERRKMKGRKGLKNYERFCRSSGIVLRLLCGGCLSSKQGRPQVESVSSAQTIEKG
jgi:hypothetical protein